MKASISTTACHSTEPHAPTFQIPNIGLNMSICSLLFTVSGLLLPFPLYLLQIGSAGVMNKIFTATDTNVLMCMY